MTAVLAYLGHGRALEGFLGTLKLLIGITLALSSLSGRTPALADLSWYYPNSLIAAPFLLTGALQLSGLVLNMRGCEWSWILRASGALIAMLMWSALLLKSSFVDQSSFVVPLAVCCLPASSFLLYKAWNRLPIPGATGLV